MEAMAPDEMDQDHRQKSGREEPEDAVQDQIRAKEQEISELREKIKEKQEKIKEKQEEIKEKQEEIKEKQEEIKEKQEEIQEKQEEIKEKQEEIKEKQEEIKEVEKEIAIASGTEVRDELKEKLHFLRQELDSLRQELGSLRQELGSLRQEIGSLRQEISSCDHQISIRDHQISICDQQISICDQQISIRDQQIIFLRQEISSVRSSASFDQIVHKLDLISGLLHESISRTRAASTINVDDLGALRSCLGVTVLPVEEEGGVTLEELLGDVTGGEGSFWDEDTYELQHKEEYMQQFKNMTRTCRDVVWKHATGRKFKRTFTNAPFPVVAKNDLVLSLRRFQSLSELGAILGVEIKRKLCWRGLRQAEVEFYVWSKESQFPFIQLITDMERGGVAIYSTGGSDVRLRTLGSMEALQDFVGGLVKSLPPGAGKDDSEECVTHPDMFPGPSRKRFRAHDLGVGSTGPQAGSSAVGRQMTFWSMIAAYNNNLGDVANLRDLDCFDLEAVH